MKFLIGTSSPHHATWLNTWWFLCILHCAYSIHTPNQYLQHIYVHMYYLIQHGTCTIISCENFQCVEFFTHQCPLHAMSSSFELFCTHSLNFKLALCFQAPCNPQSHKIVVLFLVLNSIPESSEGCWLHVKLQSHQQLGNVGC
jgi:hypothetical protein